MRRSLLALVLAGLLLGPPALGARRNPDIVEDALAFALTDRNKSALLLEDALEHEEGYRKSDTQLVMLHAGEQRRLLGQLDRSHEWFTRVLASGGRSAEEAAARLGLALVDAADGVEGPVLSVLREVRDRDALPTMNADRYLILAVRAAGQNDAPAVRTYSRAALDWAHDDPKVQERIRTHLRALTEERPEELPQPSLEPDELLAPMSDLDRAEIALVAGRHDRVRKLAAKVLEGDPSEAEAMVARYLVRRIDAAPVVPTKIAVLLPLSERYEAAGHQVQRALEYGFLNGDGRGRLQFVDSGSTPETAVAALERVALEEGVIAVAGPLLSDEVEAVAAAADAMRVPLISLSQGLEPTEAQTWVFQAMVTPMDQVKELVAYTMDHRGMKTFAVFAPDNNYGHTATEAFRAVVEERGGQITVVEFYDPAATDLIPFAEKLGRKDYETRWREFRDLKKEAEERGGNPDRVVLPPIIDFEALFLPDNASRVPIAAAALAYEEFPLGEFRTTRDGDTLPMLGLSGWNNPALLAQGGPYVRGALFTDAFWPDDAHALAFAEAYKAAFGRAPSAMEAITVDAGRLLAAATRARPQTRVAFRDALSGLDEESMHTGATGFDPERRSARRRIRILTVAEGEVVALDPKPPEQGEEDAPTGPE
ncbi:MAG: penicillin-binding protein activator [Deltaproteobacteria bacterium]|nr:penicillin-binding protein activator [Deltaproteobacteria bacterium]